MTGLRKSDSLLFKMQMYRLLLAATEQTTNLVVFFVFGITKTNSSCFLFLGLHCWVKSADDDVLSPQIIIACFAVLWGCYWQLQRYALRSPEINKAFPLAVTSQARQAHES